jgi:hypothetical protein
MELIAVELHGHSHGCQRITSVLACSTCFVFSNRPSNNRQAGLSHHTSRNIAQSQSSSSTGSVGNALCDSHPSTGYNWQMDPGWRLLRMRAAQPTYWTRHTRAEEEYLAKFRYTLILLELCIKRCGLGSFHQKLTSSRAKPPALLQWRQCPSTCLGWLSRSLIIDI